jgi:hypothetical protein
MLLGSGRIENIVGISKRELSPKRTDSADIAKTVKKNGNSKWKITFNFVQFESETEREKSYSLWADSWFQIKDVNDD